MRINRSHWCSAWPDIRGGRIVAIGVHLGDVDFLKTRTGDLLKPIAPGEMTAGERASAAADFINQRFGQGTIQFGINRPHPGFFERG
ncbi:hypothetical protein ACEUZ9_000477 [Paracoccus litorisediminis]|uniref:hypothetical protein n=1 Tax=Paracoccus litorisediminis TaxID=2006130 RepID=UPI003730DB4D